MAEGSKCFGPTAVGAGAETQLGSDWDAPPGSGGIHIYNLRVCFSNKVNAKEMAGYVRVKVAKQTGDYYYVVGHGTGAATIGGGSAAQNIPCAINSDNNAKIQVFAYNAEALVDAVISLNYRKGKGRKAVTYKCGGAGTDVTAGTEKTIGTMKVDQGAGTIREIRFTGSGVVKELSECGMLTLEIPGNEDSPFEFAVGHGIGGAASVAASHCDVIKLPHGIPVKDGVTITAKFLNLVTLGGAILSCGVSIQVV